MLSFLCQTNRDNTINGDWKLATKLASTQKQNGKKPACQNENYINRMEKGIQLAQEDDGEFTIV
jgi:hypothetical protein